MHNDISGTAMAAQKMDLQAKLDVGAVKGGRHAAPAKDDDTTETVH